MNYFTTFLVATACFFSISSAQAKDQLPWMTDFEAAKQKAEKEDKALFLFFTGSDWCGYCMQLKKKVFQDAAFIDAVIDRYVFVYLDYPRDKSGQSKELQKQNAKLEERYAVIAPPTIYLTDHEGKPFTRSGYYPKVDVKTYIQIFDEYWQSLKERNTALDEAKKLTGIEQAEKLADMMSNLDIDPHLIDVFYGDTIEQIKTLDPKDESGYVAGIEAEKKFAEFEQNLDKLARGHKHDKMFQITEEAIDSGDYKGEMLQRVVMIKGAIHHHVGNFDEALTALDEAKKVAPESKLAGRIDGLIGQIKKDQAKQSAPQG